MYKSFLGQPLAIYAIEKRPKAHPEFRNSNQLIMRFHALRKRWFQVQEVHQIPSSRKRKNCITKERIQKITSRATLVVPAIISCSHSYPDPIHENLVSKHFSKHKRAFKIAPGTLVLRNSLCLTRRQPMACVRNTCAFWLMHRIIKRPWYDKAPLKGMAVDMWRTGETHQLFRWYSPDSKKSV